MKFVSLSLLIFAAAVINASGQTVPTKPANPPAATPTPAEPVVFACPKVDIQSVNQPVRDGTPLRFTAAIAGGDPKAQPMFDWSISAGSIKAGQGTKNIDVDTTGAGAEKAITATLLIGGYPPECVSTANFTVSVAGPPQKVDEFGTLTEDEQMEHLSRLHQYVSQSDLAYIIAYGGKQGVRGAAYASLRKIRDLLLKSGIPADHIVTVDGGYREEPAHELWIVPIGAIPPKATPTVAVKDVTFIKPTPAKKP